MAIISSFNPISLRKLVKASIVPFTSPGLTVPNDSATIYPFLLNPETFTDSKDAHWVKHNIPGLSDPIQQWTYSGPRTISFTALVTRDMQGSPAVENTEASSTSANTTDFFSPVATQTLADAGISTDALSEFLQTAALQEPLDLDISDKLNFYKSLLYPITNGTLVKAPLPVFLSFGGVFGKRALKGALFVVDKVEITITKTFSDLTPIEATVAFTLTELVDKVLSSNSDIYTNG